MYQNRTIIALAVACCGLLGHVTVGNAQLFGPDPLIDGVLDGEVRAVRAALLKGSSVNVRDSAGLTGLMHASIIGSVDVTRFLLSQDALVDLADRQGNTALILAASRGHGDLVDLLIAAQANPEAENNKGETALIRAAQSGHGFTVERLLQVPSLDLESTDYTGRSAYDHALLRGHRQIAARLSRHRVSNAALKE